MKNMHVITRNITESSYKCPTRAAPSFQNKHRCPARLLIEVVLDKRVYIDKSFAVVLEQINLLCLSFWGPHVR